MQMGEQYQEIDRSNTGHESKRRKERDPFAFKRRCHMMMINLKEDVNHERI